MCASHDSESDDPDNQNRLAVGTGVHAPARRGREACPHDTVLLLNRQRMIQADWAEVRAFLDQLYSSAGGRPFSVCLVSDRAMRRFNKQYRHQDKATDVLSFPAGNGAVERRGYLGDILISAETARENAARYGVGLEEEIKSHWESWNV